MGGFGFGSGEIEMSSQQNEETELEIFYDNGNGHAKRDNNVNDVCGELDLDGDTEIDLMRPNENDDDQIFEGLELIFANEFYVAGEEVVISDFGNN